MSQHTIESLQAELALERKKLEITLAIDDIRDNAPDPGAMLTDIVATLTDFLQADLCLLSLIDRESGRAELKAMKHQGQPFEQLGPMMTPEVAEKATALDGITLWSESDIESLISSDVSLGPLQIAATPIIMGDDERLGAILIVRNNPPFTEADVTLLKIAESQIDSAIIQGYSHYELQQHIRELETIYKIDNIRDQSESLDEMLNSVLEALCQVINAEAGFVMLYDQNEQQLEIRATTHQDLFKLSAHYQLVQTLAEKSLKQGKLVYKNELPGQITSIMSLPLILNDQIIGVLGMVNRYSPRGFDADDRSLMSAIGSQIDTAIFEGIEQRRLRQVLGRSVDPRIMERLLNTPDVDFLKGERATLTVLYADIRGSTRLAEQTDPESLVGFINDYLGEMTNVIISNEGTLDKFVGDEVMALFGAPFPQEDHALRAVRVALAMQAAHQEVMDRWQARGVQAAPIGIGMATGELIVGEMGCAQRTDYTVIGNAANLGARICGAAAAGEVCISQATYDLIKDQIEAVPRSGQHFNGVGGYINIYEFKLVL
ncbi:MAG: adenylate/guanylate cyclase domain-containing protein [Chloroflexota bacterium]